MTVEKYKFSNILKMRMGARFQKQETGFLADEVIVEADKLIAEMCALSPDVLTKMTENLVGLWMEMKDMDNAPQRAELSQKIFTQAHEIKDIGSMCGYELLAYFAESLRDYIARTDLNLKAQVVIIQAHIDAIQIVNRQGVKKDAGPQAEELKKMVKMAIDKYH